jgi:phosphate/sulfate permease
MVSLLIGLAAGLSFVFGWNNSSLLIGNVRGAGFLSHRTIILIAAAGLFLGAELEGPKMIGSLGGSLAPSATVPALEATIAVSLLLTLLLTVVKLPVSFSMVMVGAFIGSSLASAVGVNASRAGEVVAYWFAAPLAAAILTYLIYRGVRRLVSNFGLLTVDRLNRAGGLVSALAVSYSLGANNIGMFYGSTGEISGGLNQAGVFSLLALAAVLGVVVLGRDSLGGTVGDRMLALSPQGVFSSFVASSIVVWAGTQLAVPVSITQCLIGGMLGAALSRNIAVVNTKLVEETLSLWVLAPIAALVVAYLVTPAL